MTKVMNFLSLSVTSVMEKILGVIFDKLNFNCHLDKLCKKAGQKIHGLARVSNFESQTKESYYECLYIISIQLLSIIMDAPFSFNKFGNKQNSPRVLSIVYRDNNSSFESLP